MAQFRNTICCQKGFLPKTAPQKLILRRLTHFSAMAQSHNTICCQKGFLPKNAPQKLILRRLTHFSVMAQSRNTICYQKGFLPKNAPQKLILRRLTHFSAMAQSHNTICCQKGLDATLGKKNPTMDSTKAYSHCRIFLLAAAGMPLFTTNYFLLVWPLPMQTQSRSTPGCRRSKYHP